MTIGEAVARGIRDGLNICAAVCILVVLAALAGVVISCF